MSEATITDKAKPAHLRRSPNWGVALLVGIFRLLLLGAAVAVGGIAGLALAQFYPGTVQEPPLVERAIASSKDLLRRVQTVAQRPTTSITSLLPDLMTATTVDGTLRITLPGDRLFAPNSSELSPEAETLLVKIASELRPYTGSVIRVAAHTDDTGNAEEDRTRSFDQANAVRRSLEKILGQDYAWMTLGYGASRPIADAATPSNRQRNRRIEIEIAPQ